METLQRLPFDQFSLFKAVKHQMHSLHHRFFAVMISLLFIFSTQETTSLTGVDSSVRVKKILSRVLDTLPSDIPHLEKTPLLKAVRKQIGPFRTFNFVETKIFLKKKEGVLPQYKEYFQTFAQKYEFPWELIAAISYQESHWNPLAKSFTGVRGMMMLTEDTATFLGVKNRLNPKQSIEGGARYLRYLLHQIPDEVPPAEKLWLALAAYNVGLGHIYDARELAAQLQLNPNQWRDLEKVLPLLKQPKYYKKLKYGYARGHEPVQFVRRVRKYYALLMLQNEM